MRTSGSDFKDTSATSDEGSWADSETHIADWLNLPKIARAVSLWDCLHDAKIVSVRSNLLERTMRFVCEIALPLESHVVAEEKDDWYGMLHICRTHDA